MVNRSRHELPAAPDDAAWDLLRQSGQEDPPVDLNRIVGLWPGLSIVCESLDGDGYLVDFGARGGEIIVRAGGHEARKRFTIAHELGHWILRNFAIEDVARCHNLASHSAVEKWCDRFAACLLMPDKWLRAELKSAKLSGLQKIFLEGPGRYGVSGHALKLRISELTLVSIFEVHWTGSRIHVSERYDCPRVSPEVLDRALLFFSGIDPHDLARPVLDTSTNFLAVSIFTEPTFDQQQRRYLLCLLPKQKR
jgi:hypothetical protein